MEREHFLSLHDTEALSSPMVMQSTPALQDTYEQWSQLNNTLEGVLDRCLHLAQHDHTAEGRDADNEALLAQVQQGVLQAAQLEVWLRQGSSSPIREPLEPPGVQLARTYSAAFEAVGVVALLLGDLPGERLPASTAPFAALLIDLAHIAAHAVHEELDLVFGRRRLGTVTNIHAYVASLENQADDVFCARVDAVLGNMRTATAGNEGGKHGVGPWPQQTAQTMRLLIALEALTDRCEDIADALLFVKYVL